MKLQDTFTEEIIFYAVKYAGIGVWNLISRKPKSLFLISKELL